MSIDTAGRSTVRRVLIYRIGSLGDTVVTLPSFHLIARAFPGSERRLVTNFPVASKAPPASAILEGTGLVQGYFRYTVGTRSVGALVSLWWQILRWRPEVLVYLGGQRGVAAAKRDALFFRLCGVKRLVGVSDTEAMQQPLTERVPVGPAGLEFEAVLEFEAARMARNIGELGDARLDEASSWELHLSAAEQMAADEALESIGDRKLIAVSVGTKVQSNEWDWGKWETLLEHLAIRYPGYALALTGAAGDEARSEAIAAGWVRSAAASHAGQSGPGRMVNLCGKLTPRESACVFRRAKVYIGHDSGPMHLAAAVQTPCVAIFSARGKPRVWFPYGKRHRVLYHRVECWGCQLDTCIVEQKRCIRSITVDEVFAAVLSVLDC